MKSIILVVLSVIFLSLQPCKVTATTLPLARTRLLRSSTEVNADERELIPDATWRFIYAAASKLSPSTSLSLDKLINTRKNTFFLFMRMLKKSSNADLAKAIFQLNIVNKHASIEMEVMLIRYWLKVKAKPIVVVRDFSKNYGQNLFGFFSERPLNLLAKYVEEYNEIHDKTPVSLYQLLRKTYDVHNLFRQLFSSRRETDHTTDSILSMLQQTHLDAMKNEGINPVSALDYIRPPAHYPLDIDQGLVRGWVLYLHRFANYNTEYFEAITVQLLESHTLDFVLEIIHLLEIVGENEIAMLLKMPLLEEWKAQGLTNERVLFEKFNDGNPPKDVAQLNMWLSYVSFNIQHNANFIQSLERLNKADLVRVLIACTHFPYLRNNANEVLSRQNHELVTNFLLRKQPFPDDLYNIFGLDQDKRTLLTNPYFEKWINYAEDYYAANGMNQYEWMSLLNDKFGMFYDMLTFIKKGKQDRNTRTIANRMEKAWFDMNLQNKKPPHSVFISLGFEDIGVSTNLFLDPEFQSWESYVENFNAKYPGRDKNVIENLVDLISMEGLVQMLHIGLESTVTFAEAEKLQKELFRFWMRQNSDRQQLEKQLGRNIVLDNYADFLANP